MHAPKAARREDENGAPASWPGFASGRSAAREFVIVVAPAEAPDGDEATDRRLLTILLGYLTPSQAAAASAISGHGRNGVYRLALAMGDAQASDGSPPATP